MDAEVAGGEAGLVEGGEAAPEEHVYILVDAALELELDPVDGRPLVGLLLKHLLQDRPQLLSVAHASSVLIDRLLQIEAFLLGSHQLLVPEVESAIA